MSDFVMCRNFKLTLISATDVEQIRKFSGTKVYATVTIGDNKATKKQTPTDKSHETNPEWNHTFEYTIDAYDVQNPGLDLLIELYIDHTHGDKRVGHASRPINELFDCSNTTREGSTRINLPLVTVDGGVTEGEVTFEYSFGEEKSVKKLSLVKKLVNAGTSMAVKAAIITVTGLYLAIPLRVFDEPEIVSNKGGRGCGILSEDFLVDNFNGGESRDHVCYADSDDVCCDDSASCFCGPEIVCSKGRRGGGGILGAESLVDIIVEGVKYL